RSLLQARGLDEVTWWVGERSAPPDLGARLQALGLEDEAEEMTTLAIESEPGGASDVEVRRVESFDDYLSALESDWAAFELSPVPKAATSGTTTASATSTSPRNS